MKPFLVNLHPNADGSLPPDKWQEAVAETQMEALLQVTNRPCNKGLFPERAFVSLGAARHDNGSPMAVTRFRLTYPDRKPS